MTSQNLIVVLSFLAVSHATSDAASQSDIATRTVQMLDCFHDGGEATIGLRGDEVETWSLTIYGSIFVTNVRASRRSADVFALRFQRRFSDESEISYQLDVDLRDGAWLPGSALAMSYGERIRQDLEAIAAWYEDTVAAARRGQSKFICTVEERGRWRPSGR